MSPSAQEAATIEEHDPLALAFRRTRDHSLIICQTLELEDFGLQRAEFVSPPKWHLAHTTWFFETFLLKPFLDGYRTPEPRYEEMFNSYYNGVGSQYPRHARGLLSRPTLQEVRRYRELVDAGMSKLLAQSAHPERATIEERCRLGIQHEMQHQELFFTDLKYSLSINPLAPAPWALPTGGNEIPATSMAWSAFDGGLKEIGFDGHGFSFDNELPRHRHFLPPFALANRLVTNGEFREFVEDGGYTNPRWWLADGWATVQEEGWEAPLYWQREGDSFLEYTLYGLLPLDDAQPVCHVSGYEADAYACWSGARLPTEQEWEVAVRAESSAFIDAGHNLYHPQPTGHAAVLQQLFGDCWQWTSSAYGPYPGFRTAAGAIGEYNGKFMSNQWVLRGGSCVTSRGHVRPSYRNFFYPRDRWQFSGIRLAHSVPDN
ncbi:MAG: ergothioneine biosynthesis protein EgtB [Halioglobus sp.]|nr:ergothioneine biosynthesis protein EgtB [Halioglobus sp.]